MDYKAIPSAKFQNLGSLNTCDPWGHLDYRSSPGFHINLEAAVRRRLRLGLCAALAPLAAGDPARRKSPAATNRNSFKAGQTYGVLGRFPFVSLENPEAIVKWPRVTRLNPENDSSGILVRPPRWR
jgi:hypothetical protein